MSDGSAEYASNDSAAGTENCGSGHFLRIDGQAFIYQGGHSQQHGEIQKTGDDTAKKTPVFHTFAGNETGQHTRENVYRVHGQPDLLFLKTQFIEAEGDGDQQDGGQQVGKEQGTEEYFGDGVLHGRSP